MRMPFRVKAFARASRLCLALLLMAGWVFSGWPRLWQYPAFPPESGVAKATPVHMLLFWDGTAGSIPSGWSNVTTYNAKLPRGESAANFGLTGGSSTHTPTSASVTASAASAGQATSGSTADSAYGHTHTALSVTIGAASNLPAYRSLLLMQFDAGIPVSIPAGAIAVFDASAPTGWTRQTAQDNNMVMVDSSVATGGSDNHTHALTWSSLGAATQTGLGNSTNQGASTGHTHTAPAATTTNASDTTLPPYIQVVIAKADSNTSSLPGGMIAMFDGDPGSAWTIASNSGGAFYQQFIRGASAYNGTSQGSETHTHTAATSGASGPASAKAKGSSTGGTSVAGPTHTHTLTATFNSASNLPPYFNVVYAKKNADVAPNAPSQDSPANNATGVSLAPTFTMTATDPDPDHISYKVTIYSDSSCTTVVQTDDQATSSTGWSGTNATCSANPASCYASGTQGNYTAQTALSGSTQYWWKASAKDPDGTGTFVDSSTCNTFTTASVAVSVTVGDGAVAYGYVAPGGSKSTSTGMWDTQTATNTGNVAEDFSIQGTNSADWTLAASAGTEQYEHAFCTASCTSAPTNYTALTTSGTSLASNVAAGAAQAFDLNITVPTSTSHYGSENVDITIVATQH